tara:strand:- start:2267 stop:2500 length:234 start_codon:yes stop_codon:yes gene_type:complete
VALEEGPVAKMIQNYKIECVPPDDVGYAAHPFEVFFETEEAMFDFMDIVPRSYTTKHYQKTDTDEWKMIGTINGWRE